MHRPVLPRASASVPYPTPRTVSPVSACGIDLGVQVVEYTEPGQELVA